MNYKKILFNSLWGIPFVFLIFFILIFLNLKYIAIIFCYPVLSVINFLLVMKDDIPTAINLFILLGALYGYCLALIVFLILNILKRKK